MLSPFGGFREIVCSSLGFVQTCNSNFVYPNVQAPSFAPISISPINFTTTVCMIVNNDLGGRSGLMDSIHQIVFCSVPSSPASSR